MTPIDMAMREITIAMDQLSNQIGNGRMPTRVSVEIDFDPNGQVRAVELHPVWRRHVQGGAVATRPVAVNGRRH